MISARTEADHRGADKRAARWRRIALEARGVYSRGRFGAWKYEVSNQDHSFAQGVECIDHLRSGAPETTLRQPEVVNARRSQSRAVAGR